MIIDTHAHLDGEEFKEDLDEVIERARMAGVERIFVPAIDLTTTQASIQLANRYPGVLYAMAGLHPEEVRANWQEQLQQIQPFIQPSSHIIATGEVGLDFYWSREFEREQLQAFEQQVQWSIETRLPLMIHCRKAQNEMVRLLRRYERDLPGGVFHCFTGNAHEAEELLAFKGFVLGIGGVLTFKKSHLPEVLPAVVPLNRIVVETDSPYMAPVPHRGKRNESSFVTMVVEKLAECYGVSKEHVAEQTTRTACHIFLDVDSRI